MAKEAYYFSHDGNARNDEKLLAVRMKYGWEGYGLYWAIIEKLREANNYECVKDYNLIAFDLRVDASVIKSLIETFGLFVFTDDGKYFYSERLKRDMGIKDMVQKSYSIKGIVGNLIKNGHATKAVLSEMSEDEIIKLNDNLKTSSNDRPAVAEQSQGDRNERKGKEIKKKESKGESSTCENPLSVEEFCLIDSEKHPNDEWNSKNKNLKFPFQSEKFKKRWSELIKTQKWKTKTIEELQETLDKLAEFDQEWATEQLEKAKVGNWGMVVFFDSKEKYLKFKIQTHGNLNQSNSNAKLCPTGIKPAAEFGKW